MIFLANHPRPLSGNNQLLRYVVLPRNFHCDYCIISSLIPKNAAKICITTSQKNLTPVKQGNYKFDWIAESDKNLATGHLEVPCKTTFQFSARYESITDKWAKSLGVSHEFQTGKRTFDDNVYLASITETDAKLIGGGEKITLLILSLLRDISDEIKIGDIPQYGNELICDGENLYIKVTYYTKDTNSKSSFVDKKLQYLKKLAEELSTFKSTELHFWKVPSQLNTAVILAISSSLAILGGLEAIRFFIADNNLLFNSFSLMPYSIVIALLGLGVLVWATFKLIKKSSRRHLVLFEVCISGFFGLAFSVYGWLYDANMTLDTSSPKVMHYQVLEKYTQRHRLRKGLTTQVTI